MPKIQGGEAKDRWGEERGDISWITLLSSWTR